jgi:hypothetical protein
MRKVITGCAVLLMSAAVASANLLINPGFEDESTVLAGWSQSGWYAGAGADAHSGTYGASREITSSIGGENYFVTEQYVPVTGNLSYDFSGWMRIAGTPTASESFLELRWMNSSGGSEGQYGTTHVTANQDYAQYSLLEQVAPTLAVTARVALVVHTTGGTITDTAWHTFDDIDFDVTVIPEPGTLALCLMGLGFGSIVMYRRRKNG